jgi:diguanylate cyclase (GGDEF)-like protein
MRSLRNRLDDEIARSSATGSQLSLVMLDLDDFKKVNDVYGHSRGDNVLAGVADALRQTVRRSEMPARRGGDEFAVILTDASEHDAAMAVNRFGVAIERARQALCDGVNSTASIGYTTWRIGDTTDDLFERADAALHDAKVRAHESRAHTAAAGGLSKA